MPAATLFGHAIDTEARPLRALSATVDALIAFACEAMETAPEEAPNPRRHPEAYLALLWEAVTPDASPADIKAWAARYASKDPAYTTTKAGLGALAFEMALIKTGGTLIDQFVETVVEKSGETFHAVFIGKLHSPDLEKLERVLDGRVTWEVLSEYGAADYTAMTRSEVTIWRCTAKAVGKEAKPEKDWAGFPASPSEYGQVSEDGGVPGDALMKIHEFQIEDRGALLPGLRDKRGVLWEADDRDNYKPDAASVAAVFAPVEPAPMEEATLNTAAPVRGVQHIDESDAQTVDGLVVAPAIVMQGDCSCAVTLIEQIGGIRYVVPHDLSVVLEHRTRDALLEFGEKNGVKVEPVAKEPAAPVAPPKPVKEEPDDRMDAPLFYRDDMQAYYDTLVLLGLDADECKSRTKRKFKIKELVVTPTGEVRSPGIGERPASEELPPAGMPSMPAGGETPPAAAPAPAPNESTEQEPADEIDERVRNAGITRRGEKSYPAVVRAWAARDGLPLKKVQAMWDRALDDVESDDEAPSRDDEATRPEFYKAVMRLFRSEYQDAIGESIDEALSDDVAKDAFVPGKSVLIKNLWWTIKSRDIEANEVVLALSDWAKKDGAKAQADKRMPFTTLVSRVRSGTWGAKVNGAQHGPEQDAKKRDNLRKANGLSAAPGAAKFREQDESIDEAAGKIEVGDLVSLEREVGYVDNINRPGYIHFVSLTGHQDVEVAVGDVKLVEKLPAAIRSKQPAPGEYGAAWKPYYDARKAWLKTALKAAGRTARPGILEAVDTEPTKTVKKMCADAGKDEATTKRIWKHATDAASEKYEVDSDEWWAYAMGVVKKACGIDEDAEGDHYINEEAAPKIDWSGAPKWAKWHSVAPDGTATWWSKRPGYVGTRDEGSWVERVGHADTKQADAPPMKGVGHWLTKRGDA